MPRTPALAGRIYPQGVREGQWPGNLRLPSQTLRSRRIEPK